MATVIHPTAIVDKNAQLGIDVSVGPYAIIEDDTVIGDRCQIGMQASICSGTRMAEDCRVFKGAHIGEVPQDLKFGGEKTLLKIGNSTTIREFCTLNRGTLATGETVIGSHSLLMTNCHVAHDCKLGDYLIMANNSSFAGHVEVGHHVNIGGVSSVVQFRKIGDNVHLSAYSLIVKDVVPFAMVASDPLRIIDINRIGLARAGFTEERRRDIKRAYKILFRQGLTTDEACKELLQNFPANQDIEKIVAFVNVSGKGILRMRENDGSAND